MTMVYFALNGSPTERRALLRYSSSHRVNVLISFFYLKSFLRNFEDVVDQFSSTMLDSGAFSAHMLGIEIDQAALEEEARKKRWKEVIALDVVGNPQKSMQNALQMSKIRPDCMPVFHIGEPFEWLHEYCAKFQKVGLSCRFGESPQQSRAWLRKCFYEAWPHPFHSFGYIKRDVLSEFPFHSADASSWKAPERFGRHNNPGWSSLEGRGRKTSNQTLDPEVQFYLDLQSFLEAKWKKELSKLNTSESKLPKARSKRSNGRNINP